MKKRIVTRRADGAQIWVVATAMLRGRPLDKPPQPLTEVQLVRRNGTTARGMWIAEKWNVIDGDWLMWADTAEFIGWRGMP